MVGVHSRIHSRDKYSLKGRGSLKGRDSLKGGGVGERVVGKYTGSGGSGP